MEQEVGRTAWLAQLKAGDEVFVEDVVGNRGITRVVRTTKAQVHVGSAVYWRRNGELVGMATGGHWNRSVIRPVGLGDRLWVEHRELRKFLLEAVQRPKITLAELRAMKRALDAERKLMQGLIKSA